MACNKLCFLINDNYMMSDLQTINKLHVQNMLGIPVSNSVNIVSLSFYS